MNVEKALGLTGKYISEKRLEHVKSVISECQSLASLLGMSEEETKSLLLAAALHDITKELPYQKQLQLRIESGIIKSVPFCEATAHQDTGRYLASLLCGKEIPEEALSAIGCHTTGKPGMSLVDMALFTADFIEPQRKWETCRNQREYFYSKCKMLNPNDYTAKRELLKVTVLEILKTTADFTEKHGGDIDSRSLEAIKYLENR